MELTAEHLDTLRRAKACLEHPSLAARLMDVLASPLDGTMGRLPRKWSGLVQSATRKAIGKGLAVAVATSRAAASPPHSGPPTRSRC